jgi:hypothetical protein
MRMNDAHRGAYGWLDRCLCFHRALLDAAVKPQLAAVQK